MASAWLWSAFCFAFAAVPRPRRRRRAGKPTTRPRPASRRRPRPRPRALLGRVAARARACSSFFSSSLAALEGAQRAPSRRRAVLPKLKPRPRREPCTRACARDAHAAGGAGAADPPADGAPALRGGADCAARGGLRCSPRAWPTWSQIRRRGRRRARPRGGGKGRIGGGRRGAAARRARPPGRRPPRRLFSGRARARRFPAAPRRAAAMLRAERERAGADGEAPRAVRAGAGVWRAVWLLLVALFAKRRRAHGGFRRCAAALGVQIAVDASMKRGASCRPRRRRARGQAPRSSSAPPSAPLRAACGAACRAAQAGASPRAKWRRAP